MNQIDSYLSKFEPHKSAMVHYLIKEILRQFPGLIVKSSFGLPFIYGKKGICYFNLKKHGVDVGFMYGVHLTQHADFVATNRKQVRSLFFTWEEDIDLNRLFVVVKEAVDFDLR